MNHGGDIYRNKVDIDFSVTLNPYGIPEKVAKALEYSIKRAGQYPDIRQEEVRNAIGHLTGLENLQIVQKLKGASEEEIVRVLKTVRLYEQRDKKLKNYSLGMRQRLGLAMALLGEPKLLILDEPTNGLDPAGIQEIRELIRSLPKERDMTVIVSSHLLNEVEQMADHVGIIHHGEMLYQGPLSELEKQGGNLEDVFLLMTGGGESL